MATQPTVVKDYKICYAPYAADAPAFNVSEGETSPWIEVENTFKGLPNFFPKGDTIDTSTVDRSVKTSIEGIGGGEEYVCNCLYTTALADMHTQLVSDKFTDGKGYSWIKIEYTNRQVAMIGKFTCNLYLPSPEAELGAIDEIEFTLYSQGHSYVNYTASLITLDLTSVAGEEDGHTKLTVDRACPSHLIAEWQTDTTIATPEFDNIASLDYEPFFNNAEYTATTGNEVAVVYIDPSTRKIKYFGKADVVSNT